MPDWPAFHKYEEDKGMHLYVHSPKPYHSKIHIYLCSIPPNHQHTLCFNDNSG